MPETPPVIPIFPLPNVVLFPRLQLPLHIFEPRYREMVRDALASDGWIGMALLKGDWEKDYYGNPEIYSVGCLGKIVGTTPLPDGRYNILLHGVREYEVREDIFERTRYRRARVALREEAAAAPSDRLDPLKKEILDLIGQVVEGDSSFLKTLADPSLDGETWVNLCCFGLDISTVEKQSLLEAKSLEARAAHLASVLRFMAAERHAPFDSVRGSREGKLPH